MVNISSSVNSLASLKSASLKSFVVMGMATTMLATFASAQTPEQNAAAYKSILQAIAAEKVSLAQQQLFVARQDGEISSLNQQLASVDELKAAIEPMVGKMTAGIARQVNSDYPFEMDRRLPRLESLQATIADPNASIVDKYRKVLNVYKLEVNYGQSLEAKKGNHPVNPTIRVGDDRWVKNDDGTIKYDKKTGLREEIFDGTYLRYGRLAYVYLDADSSGAMRYDLKQQKWVDLPKKNIVDIRRAVRIANGEAAPKVVRVPVFNTP